MTETRPVRQGEEIDAARLSAYLSDVLPRDGEVEISQFPAGSSNLTYLITSGDSEYVLRRPPFGNTVKTAHDMHREFDVLSKLSAVYPPAPKPILFCDDTNIIGSEFYLMERRRGLIIRGSINSSRAREESIDGSPRVGSPHVSEGSSRRPDVVHTPHDLTTQPARMRVCSSFIQTLADLHALDQNAAGLSDLGKPEGYNRRQVEGWTKRYFAAKTGELPELEAVITWLNKNIPSESGASLVHNDYKFDNVMLDPDELTKVTAVLDWEMVTIGDPLMDLGTTFGYWMSPDAGEDMLNMPFNPRVLMENISRRDLVEMYSAASGRTVLDMLFYYVFGTFKIAVIAQQIYARYVKGSTKDPRFSNFNKFVSALAQIAATALKRGSI